MYYGIKIDIVESLDILYKYMKVVILFHYQMFDWHYKMMVFFCLFYHLNIIFKEDIMVDHCSVFMMVTKKDDLGGDGT